MKRGSSLILVLMAVFSGGAAFYSISSSKDYLYVLGNGNLVFPLLHAAPEKAKLLSIEAGERRLKFKQQGDFVWVSENKFGYPASSVLLKKVISQLADMRKIEAKTKMASRYNQIGVESPYQPGANSVLVRLEGANGEVLAESILGAQFRRNNIGIAEGTFIRHPKKQQAWLASGNIEIPNNLVSWLDTRITNFGPTEIKQIKLWLEPGNMAIVDRPEYKSAFIYQNRLGVGYLDKEISKELSKCLSKLSFLDVWPRNRAKKRIPVLKFEVETFSGKKISGQLFESHKQKILQLSAEEEDTREKLIQVSLEKKIYSELNKWTYVIPSWQAERFLVGLTLLKGDVQQR